MKKISNFADLSFLCVFWFSSYFVVSRQIRRYWKCIRFRPWFMNINLSSFPFICVVLHFFFVSFFLYFFIERRFRNEMKLWLSQPKSNDLSHLVSESRFFFLSPTSKLINANQVARFNMRRKLDGTKQIFHRIQWNALNEYAKREIALYLAFV